MTAAVIFIVSQFKQSQIFDYWYVIKYLYPQYIKNSYNSIIRQSNENGQMLWIDTSQKKRNEWPINMWKYTPRNYLPGR